uniref:Mitochondrial K+-H+ exchange-related-domain-containing protein n=1 Tax=Tetradesmus obliquus TaxID=3088 RepID=A0A383VAC5_TETOB|eukprot:jgi/Sobl393_1/6611/SZX61893.1
MASTQVKVLVLPVLRRYWLFHAWKEVPPQPPGVKPSWRDTVQSKVVASFQSQWTKLEAAPQGTLNHRLFKFGQYVLSKVDPSESFLKALPQQADSLDILYPASLPERLVRRRLRLLAAKAQPFHASRFRMWIGILLPQIPLIPLPLPNVTIYYTIWRIASNRSAGRGAASLAAALELASDAQRLKLAQQLRQLQQQGVQLQQGSWAEHLAAEADSLQQQVQQQKAANSSSSSSSSREQPAEEQQPRQLPLPVFIPDKHLDQLVEPAERLLSPLPESAVLRLAELYDQHHLMEHYRAANRKCLDEQQQPQQQQ